MWEKIFSEKIPPDSVPGPFHAPDGLHGKARGAGPTDPSGFHLPRPIRHPVGAIPGPKHASSRLHPAGLGVTVHRREAAALVPRGFRRALRFSSGFREKVHRPDGDNDHAPTGLPGIPPANDDGERYDEN